MTNTEKQDRKKRIYIAGKVSGEHKLACATKFDRAAKKIEALGYDPINPLEVVGTWDISWQDAMKKALSALMQCDGIFPLPDANESKGAILEVELAIKLDIADFENLKQSEAKTRK